MFALSSEGGRGASAAEVRAVTICCRHRTVEKRVWGGRVVCGRGLCGLGSPAVRAGPGVLLRASEPGKGACTLDAAPVVLFSLLWLEHPLRLQGPEGAAQSCEGSRHALGSLSPARGGRWVCPEPSPHCPRQWLCFPWKPQHHASVSRSDASYCGSCQLEDVAGNTNERPYQCHQYREFSRSEYRGYDQLKEIRR